MEGGWDTSCLGEGVGCHFFEAWEFEDKKLFPMTSNELIFFEAAEDAASGLFREPGHIGQVLGVSRTEIRRPVSS